MDTSVYPRLAAIEDRHWWFRARRQILDTVLRRHVAAAGGADVLEAGCGTGGNMALLARFGRLSAFDMSPQAITFACGRGLGDIAEGALPDGIPFDGRMFDLVAALDVLEHVGPDRAAVRALGARLRPGGLLVATVPAFGFLWSGHDAVHHHRRRYRRSELSALVCDAGLEPLVLTYFNMLLFLPIAAMRVMARLSGRAGGDDTPPGRLLNRTLEAVFGLERHLVGRVPLPFGVSLLVIARRPHGA
jgi:SAM-dependent methyltransferase